MSAASPLTRVTLDFLLIIPGQPQSRLRRSFALPTNFVHFSGRQDFFGRVRLRPNRNLRAKFDVGGFALEPGDTRFFADNTGATSISAQTELRPTNQFR